MKNRAKFKENEQKMTSQEVEDFKKSYKKGIPHLPVDQTEKVISEVIFLKKCNPHFSGKMEKSMIKFRLEIHTNLDDYGLEVWTYLIFKSINNKKGEKS